MSNDSSDLSLLMTPLKSKEELQDWLLVNIGIELPHQCVTKFANSNPLDFVWEVYEAIREGKSLAIMAISGRDASKTVSLSIIDILAFLHDKRDAVHLAMTTTQANRAKNYVNGFINKHEVLRKSITKENTKELQLQIDNDLVGIEILPMTPKAVQGSHASLVTFDELASSMDPQLIRGYKDAHGILGASKNGKPAVVVKITSRQSGDSLAEREIQNAPKTGLKIVNWTTLDCTERCPDERSGTIPTPLYVNIMRGEALTEEEFHSRPPSAKEGFERTEDTFDKCRACPLASACCGSLRNQTSTSVLLRKIDDVINKINLAGSWDWALAQIFSLKPSSEGLVYFEYNSSIHSPGWNKMWEVLTGLPSNKEVTRESFLAECKRRKVSFYAGQDWGWSNPSTCVVVGIDNRDNCYVMEAIGRTYTSDPDFINLIKTDLQPKYDIQMCLPDTENGSGVFLLKQAGFVIPEDWKKTRISLGVNIVKGFLKTPGTNKPKLFFAPDLPEKVGQHHPGLIGEMGLYRKKQDAAGNIIDGEFEDSNNHFNDALRYILTWRFGKSFMKVGTDYTKDLEMAKIFHPDHLNMKEVARSQGIQFEDNTEDTPGDDDGGSNGGFDFRFT